MPLTRELTINYGGTNIGGSTARQITEWVKGDAGYESEYHEFEFITSASTDAAFATELSTLRTAFRTPRQDFTITQNGSTLHTLKQSNNTGFDSDPHIIKDGDPADTGRSRHFRIRIYFGLPADVIAGNNFRRYSTIAVNYSPSRQRTLTISGTYTANSTDGTTAAFTQYRNQIATYASSVTSFIDNTANWEIIGEPQVEYNDTNKVCAFSIVYREILHSQSQSLIDDTQIIDPVMSIIVESIAPGDSTGAGIFNFSQAAVGPVPGSGPGSTQPQDPTASPGVGPISLIRPQRIIVTYNCAIDVTKTKSLSTAWKGKIRGFLISEAQAKSNSGIVLIKEDPGYDDYFNRINATMEFISYQGVTKYEQEILISESVNFGKTLAPVTTPDPYDYYEWPGPAMRQRTVNITYKQPVSTADPQVLLDSLSVEIANTVNGITNSAKWMPISQKPAVKSLFQGLAGTQSQTFAVVSIERTAQRRNKKKASVANAGGITGAGLTG